MDFPYPCDKYPTPNPSRKGRSFFIFPTLAEDSRKDFPLAEIVIFCSPSLAEGVRGWVILDVMIHAKSPNLAPEIKIFKSRRIYAFIALFAISLRIFAPLKFTCFVKL
ncbi:hypothetical protein [Helicobacter sp. 23-1045]